MADDIAQWLEELGLGQYAQVFAENGIELGDLPHLREDDFERLGLLLGHTRRLQAAIEALSTSAPKASSDPLSAIEPEFRHGEAERRQLTVMFCDLVGSTVLSAKLDPEDMREVLLAYQNVCSRVIARYDGYVAKFMGDGVYAYFGYPRAHEEDAERAINAGLGIVEAVQRLEHKLEVRIGIATGTVAVGDLVGEGASEEAAVIGEAPNLAARLQEIADPNTVVIGEATRALAGRLFKTTDLGSRALKGFAQPVPAWSVSARRQSESRFDAIRGEQLSVLVGREEELGILLRRWQRAQAGEGQVVLISGEPGIGKSRLLHTFLQRVDRETYVRILQCSPHHTNSAMFPFAEQLSVALELGPELTNGEKLEKLEAWIRLADQDPEQVAQLFAPILGIDADERYSPLDIPPQRQKEMMLEAFAERLARISAGTPMLVVVEDAHWIDPTSLELVGIHAEQARDLPNAMVVVTYRPEFEAPWVGQPRTTLIALSRLDRAQCTTLASNISGAESLPAEVITRINERADGVPLFVEELTKAVVESSREHPKKAIADVPATLQDSLEARLDRLGSAKEIAEIAAAIGRSFDYELLNEVSPTTGTQLNLHLDLLVGSGLLLSRGVPPTATYTFKHALVQDTAYQAMLKGTRQGVHARIAKALEDRLDSGSEVPPETVAFHLTEADLPVPAIGYWRRAGEQSAQRSADHEAVAQFGQALDLLSHLPESADRDQTEFDILVRLNGPLMAAKGFTGGGVEDVQTRAMELAERLPEATGIFPILYGRYMYFQSSNRVDLARETGDQFMRFAEQSGQANLQPIGHRMLGAASWRMGLHAAASEHLKCAVDLYDLDIHGPLISTYGVDVMAAAQSVRGVVDWMMGYPDRAFSNAAAALNHARSVGHANSLGYALAIGVITVHAIARDFEGTERIATELSELADKFELADYPLLVQFHRGRGQLEAGELAAGLKMMRECFREDPHRSEWHWNWEFHAALMAEALGVAGKFAEAHRWLDRAQSYTREGGGRSFEPEIWRTRGDVLLANRDANEAAASFAKAIDIAHGHDSKSLELRAATRLARLWQSQGKTDEARDLLAPIYSWFTEGFDTADLKDAQALLDQLN